MSGGRCRLKRRRPKRRSTTVFTVLGPTLALALALLTSSCRRPTGVATVADADEAAPVPGGMGARPLKNRFAYIPPQCYTATRERAGGTVYNPCYACHQRPVAPNFVDDSDLQLAFTFP